MKARKIEICTDCHHVVLDIVQDRRKQSWQCRCDCGMTVLINTDDLVEGGELLCDPRQPCKFRNVPVIRADGYIEHTH